MAADHIAFYGWDNIELVNAPADTARLAVHANAALFAAAPHALACPSAVTNILAHLRASAVIAAGGWKWPIPSPWLWPLRACLAALHHAYDADTTPLQQPWNHRAEHATGLHITELGFGTGYLAHAYTAPQPPQALPREQQ